jgi:hypothetical protein
MKKCPKTREKCRNSENGAKELNEKGILKVTSSRLESIIAIHSLKGEKGVSERNTEQGVVTAVRAGRSSIIRFVRSCLVREVEGKGGDRAVKKKATYDDE